MAITITPTEPTAVVDACLIAVSGASNNDAADYDTGQYPTQAELRCYLAFVLGGVERNRSYVFAVSGDGDHDFPNFVFDTAGTWTVNLCRADNDSVLDTAEVTVA